MLFVSIFKVSIFNITFKTITFKLIFTGIIIRKKFYRGIFISQISIESEGLNLIYCLLRSLLDLINLINFLFLCTVWIEYVQVCVLCLLNDNFRNLNCLTIIYNRHYYLYKCGIIYSFENYEYFSIINY